MSSDGTGSPNRSAQWGQRQVQRAGSSEDVFESYAPGRGWRLGPPLAVPRHALGLFASAGRLWAVGGCVVPELEDSRVVESRPLR